MSVLSPQTPSLDCKLTQVLSFLPGAFDHVRGWAIVKSAILQEFQCRGSTDSQQESLIIVRHAEVDCPDRRSVDDNNIAPVPVDDLSFIALHHDVQHIREVVTETAIVQQSAARRRNGSTAGAIGLAPHHCCGIPCGTMVSTIEASSASYWW